MRRATGGAVAVLGLAEISTHALREEGDVSGFASTASAQEFLPTPSVRRATVHLLLVLQAADISTHALREEGDLQARDVQAQEADFYPRPP